MKARNCISAKDYYWKWESRAQGFDQGDAISGVAFSTNPGISTLNPEPKKTRNSDTEKTAPHDLKNPRLLGGDFPPAGEENWEPRVGFSVSLTT